MLDMGFLHDIEEIVGTLPKRRQTLMFSATLSKAVESLARRFLYQPKMVQIGKRSNPADTVAQCVYEVPTHLKNALLLELLRQPGFAKVLVFARMKDGADRLTNFLRLAQVKVAKLHSSRSQDQRLQALQDFKDGKAQVLVATDIVARGIDIDGVSHVVNFELPNIPESYVHRIGRTARAGASGIALAFCDGEERAYLRDIEKLTRVPLTVVEAGPLAAVPPSSAPSRSFAPKSIPQPSPKPAARQPRRDESSRPAGDQPGRERNRRDGVAPNRIAAAGRDRPREGRSGENRSGENRSGENRSGEAGAGRSAFGDLVSALNGGGSGRKADGSR